MHSHFLKYIHVISCVVIIALASCEDDKYAPVSIPQPIPETPDFRDSIIGKYSVIEIISCYGPCGACYSTKDTTISVNYGVTDSTYNVLGWDAYLGTTGTYTAYHYGLTFRNDSIFSYFMNGGLGCGQNVSHVGVRTSPIP